MSETNKDITVAFYKMAVFEGRVEDAFRLYAGTPYRQHNPLVEDGMEGLKKFFAGILSNHPDARGEIKRVFADGDHVILHSHWHGLSDNSRGEAVVDIFRLEGGKVLEHWDVSSQSRKRRPTPTRCSELRRQPARAGENRRSPPSRCSCR